jgi:hypothetical protein
MIPRFEIVPWRIFLDPVRCGRRINRIESVIDRTLKDPAAYLAESGYRPGSQQM